jgi:formiminotetrahydrofolate cyclodeaminase
LATQTSQKFEPIDQQMEIIKNCQEVLKLLRKVAFGGNPDATGDFGLSGKCCEHFCRRLYS